MGNGAQINAGLEQMDCRAVTETVWMNALGFKGGHLFCGVGDVPSQNQPHAKSRQAIAPMIAKKRAVIVGIPARIAEVLFQQLDGLRPERADALFTPLAEQSHAGRRYQPKIGSAQRDDLLHPCARVEHECQ